MPFHSARKRQPDLDHTAIRRRLLGWYRRHARELPWRRRAHDPYAVWLSEVMLQQTQAATVAPYFESFLRRFPTVDALAGAERAEVLRMWAGLGYYRRAHQLHDAAREVANARGGCFPDDVAELMTLPGIGRYTAGAIASIAFGRRAPVLDGNVKRVLARLTASTAPPDEPAELRRLWSLAEALLPKRGCGDFNQALMELGATVCTPRQPACSRCPLAANCAAHRSGRAADIPPPRKRATVRELTLICYAVSTGNALLVRERPAPGLWAGAWAPPVAEMNGISKMAVATTLLPQAVLKMIPAFADAGTVQHQLTHRRVTFHVLRATTHRVRLPRAFRWLPFGEINTVPTAFRKVAALIDQNEC